MAEHGNLLSFYHLILKSRFSLPKRSFNPPACNSCGQSWFAVRHKDLIQQKAVNDLLLAMNDGAKEGARMAEEAKTFLNGLEDSINDAWHF